MSLKISTVFLFLFLVTSNKTIYKKGKILNRTQHKITIRQPMANFTPIFESTEGWEGGYQNYASDNANYTSSGNRVGTNRGISAIAYEQYLGYEPTVADMKAITRERAKAVYIKLFWNKIRGNELKNQDVADIIFATYIGNPARSNIIVKTSLAKLGKDVTVKTPYSDEVVKAINKTNPEKLFYTIKEEKRLFLESLRYSYPQFIGGWMRKLESFEYGGAKKKWLIITAVLIVIVSGSYYAYKKGYIKNVKSWV